MISAFLNRTYKNAQTDREQYPSIPLNSAGGDEQFIVCNFYPSQESFFGSVVIKTNTINLNRIESGAAFYNASLTQIVTAALYPSQESFFGSVIIKTNTINLDRIESTLTFFQSSVSPGAVNISCNLITSTIQFPLAQIAPSSNIDLNLTASVATFFNASILNENLIEAQLIESQEQFFLLTLSTASKNSSDLLLLGTG